MKSFLVAIFLSVSVLTLAGCGTPSGKSGARKLLSGKAALGAFFPDGSQVELRGEAVVPTPGPSTSPSPQQPQPSQVLTTTVRGNAGDYTVDVSGLAAPYLIRVKDASTGTWYYSYTDGTQLVANANPYTDMLVRSWYTNASQIGGNPANVNIDSVFTSGVYPSGTANIVSLNPPTSSGTLPDNTPISLPDPAAMTAAGQVLSATISRAYFLDLENVLTATWVPGVGFDALLDSIGVAKLKPIIDSSLNAAYFAPASVTSAALYLEVVRTQVGPGVTGSSSVQIVADVYSAATSLQVKDARAGHGEFVNLTSGVGGDATHFGGALAVASLPGVTYQLTVNGNVSAATSLNSIVYGTLTLAGDGSVSGYTPGLGATVDSATGGSIHYSVSDLTPVDVRVMAHGSQTILFEKSYPRGATFSGSDSLAYDTGGQAFDLYLVGSSGERTVVQYSP